MISPVIGMKKAMVIGCPGSGKSTFSRMLHEITGLPLIHLDMLNWNPDRTTVEKIVFRQRLETVLKEDAWIIDGNYGSTLEMRMKECDTVFFLDYPLDVCLQGIWERIGKPRMDIPWRESEDYIDPEFETFVRNFEQDSKPKILFLLDRYKEKHIVIFKSREEAEGYLRELAAI